jgi:hypothetical protein
VVFAYKDQLYFRKGTGRCVEVLAVGIKNTQDRELEFLTSLLSDQEQLALSSLKR